MSDRSPEIDCVCSNLSKDKEDNNGYTFRHCLDCGRVFILVANGPDDCEWEDTGKYLSES